MFARIKTVSSPFRPHVESLESRLCLAVTASDAFTLLDFEADVLPDRSWLLSQPAGTQALYLETKDPTGGDDFYLAAGEGRNGSQALVVESTNEEMGLPGFWVLNGLSRASSIDQADDDAGYILPRGMRANRLEFWVRFDTGYRVDYASDPKAFRNIDIGTYHYDPGKNSPRVVESDNWHFYNKLMLRHDQAGDEWFHVVLNDVPQDQRGVSGARMPKNPTSHTGNHWELLTRFYVDSEPRFTDPEIEYPIKMWVDDIKLSYVEEPELVEVQFEGALNGQEVTVVPGVTQDLIATVTNPTSASVTGILQNRAVWTANAEILDPENETPLSSEITLEPGESRQVLYRITPKDSLPEGRQFPIGLLFVPDGEILPRVTSLGDANIELDEVYGYTGPADGTVYGAFLNARTVLASTNSRPVAQGGITFETPLNTSLQGVIPAGDSDGDELTFTLLEQTSENGTISLDPQTGAFSFSPANGFEGIFRFRYQVNDGSQDSKPAASWIIVESSGGDSSAPIVTNDSVSIVENADPETVSANVLDNDSDSNDALLTVSHVDGSAAKVGATLVGEYGWLVINVDGSFTYSLDNVNEDVQNLGEGESRIEAFTYTVSNGSHYATGLISIEIEGIDDDPNLRPVAITDENGIFEDANPNTVGGNVLANDFDENGDDLTVIRVDGTSTNVGTNLNGDYGVLNLQGNGAYVYTLDNTVPAVNELNQGGTLSESFSYVVSDGELGVWSSLTITIYGMDDESDPRIRRDDLLVRSGSTLVSAVSGTDGLTVRNMGNWNDSVEWQDFATADVNGDGLDDVVGRYNGNWWVGVSDGSTFQTSTWGAWSTNVTWVDVRIADVNGDGNDDILGRTEKSGNWWVARSTGTEFINEKWGTWSSSRSWSSINVADVNGDGLDDLVGRLTDVGSWWVALSSGDRFANENWGAWSADLEWVDVSIADVNGDGKDDVIGRANGNWWVGISDGFRFQNQRWGEWANQQWLDVLVGDFNNDGLADVAGRTQAGQWWLSRSNGTEFINEKLGVWSSSVVWNDVSVGDFDGDGRDDIVGRTNNRWWLGRWTTEGFINELWGQFESDSWRDLEIGNFA